MLRSAAVAGLVLMAAGTARADAPRPHLASVGVEQLKRAYLECDRIASRTLMDAGLAAQCSMVGEELKHRVFAGDFDRLIAWWREHKGPYGDAMAGVETRDDDMARAP
jgi:hypothetical protein